MDAAIRPLTPLERSARAAADRTLVGAVEDPPAGLTAAERAEWVRVYQDALLEAAGVGA